MFGNIEIGKQKIQFSRYHIKRKKLDISNIMAYSKVCFSKGF